MRRLSAAICILGLSAYLGAAGAAVAHGLLLCIEADGQVAAESSVLGTVCGPEAAAAAAAVAGRWITAADVHCQDCDDLPLRLEATETPRRVLSGRMPAMLPAQVHPAAAALPHLRVPVAVLPAVVSLSPAPRANILRI